MGRPAGVYGPHALRLSSGALERLIRAHRHGVDMPLLEERFGMDATQIRKALRKAGEVVHARQLKRPKQ